MNESGNVFAVIKRETAALAEHPAVVEGAVRLGYGQLIAAAEAAAAALRRAGIGPARRVGLLAHDSSDYIVISLALLALEAVVVPVSPEQPAAEREAVTASLALDFLIAEALLVDPGRAIATVRPGVSARSFHVIGCPGQAPDNTAFARLHPAFIRFSSGTTGASKGVVLSHRAILERTAAADRALRITRDDTVLWVLSMSYHFVVTILLFLRRGATIVLCGHPFPGALIDGVNRQRGTFAYASPLHYALLARSGEVAAGALDRVRMAVSTATRLPAEVADEFAARFGFELTEAYGIIEVGLPFVRLGGGEAKRGSVGQPLPDFEVRIDHPDGDGVGAILIRGPGMLDAYFAPWRERREICPDGWFNTGDLGRIDDDGYLYIVGREKEVINFVGMKIFPQEVEAVLDQHPAVRESRVHGSPHPRYGELPVARIVVRDGCDGDILLDELRRFCYQRLTPYKVPKEFIIVDRLEKTGSGKLRRA